LEVEVGPNGNVESVRIVQSSGDPAMDEAAMEAARKSSYAPATLNGLPVHGECIIDFPVDEAGA
jgi:protein TonB